MYGITLVRRVGLLPHLGSIEAWHAIDRGNRVTLVRSRPDIVARHLLGDRYGSNIEAFDADLRGMVVGRAADGELALLELRHVEDGIPLGLFAPLDGWMLRDIAAEAKLDSELAAALVLAIVRSYEGGPDALTVDGNLVRRSLPAFEAVYEAEMPSLTGLEPEISMRGRIDEAHHFLATIASDVDLPDDAFLAELARRAHPDLGPALVRAL